MAIARCQHCGEPQKTKDRYPHAHLPLPDSGILCGARHCTRPALVWLTDGEEEQYRRGVREFIVIRNYHVQVE